MSLGELSLSHKILKEVIERGAAKKTVNSPPRGKVRGIDASCKLRKLGNLLFSVPFLRQMPASPRTSCRCYQIT